MSRNGAGYYTLDSRYLVAEGDTILPSQHNPVLEDIATDLNTPRPIVAGGTGASTATTARTNLSVYSISDTDSKFTRLVASRTALKALDTASVKAVVLTEAGRQKLFMWTTGDFTAAVAGDPSELNYIPADGIAVSIGCWVAATGGEGDMASVFYDPNGINADVFDMDNMVEGTDTKIMTAAERASIASAVQPGDLATVATSGAYSDLSGTPTLGAVATSNDYGDLDNLPTLGTASAVDTIDEDDMASDSASKVPTQQSVKAYVDTGTVHKVADRTALKAVDTGAHSTVYFGGYNWRWDSSDLSAQVSIDTVEGIYVAPTSDDTGASGAWVRQFVGPIATRFFQPDTTGTTDAKSLFEIAAALSGDPAIVDVDPGTYKLSGNPSVSQWVTWRFLGEVLFVDGSGVSTFPGITTGTLIKSSPYRDPTDALDYSSIRVMGDEAASDTKVNAFRVTHNYGGSGAVGGRHAGYFVLNQTGGATSASNDDRNYVGLQSQVITASGDGGTGTTLSTSKGAYFGFSSIVNLNSGAVNILNPTGAEFDTQMLAGSSAYFRSCVQAASLDTVDATISCNYHIGSSGAAVGRSQYGILYSDVNGGIPISSTGTAIGVKAIAQPITISTIMDFTQTTVSDNLFNLPKWRVNASGNMDLGSLSATQTTSIDFHSSGQNNDYDVRLESTGGTLASGGGTFSLRATTLTVPATRPQTDNVSNLGSASFRFATVYAGTGTINTSDESLKKIRGPLSEAEIRAWSRVSPLIYRWKDAVAEKDDGARLHAGYIAQHVEDAFRSEGLDPWAYGLLCKDRVVREVEKTVSVERPVFDQQEVERLDITIVDGRAIQKKVVEMIQVARMIDIPVIDECGSPVMIKREVLNERGQYIRLDVEGNELVLDDDGIPVDQKYAKSRPIFKYENIQATHSVQVTEMSEEIVTEVVDAGERLGLRYVECLVMETAYLRSLIARATTKALGPDDYISN